MGSVCSAVVMRFAELWPLAGLFSMQHSSLWAGGARSRGNDDHVLCLTPDSTPITNHSPLTTIKTFSSAADDLVFRFKLLAPLYSGESYRFPSRKTLKGTQNSKLFSRS